MGRWSISFRSGDFNGDDRRPRPKRGGHPAGDLTTPASGEGQHPCPRGPLCASSTRDADGVWHPLLVNGAFCPADESAIANAIPDLPRSWFLLSARIGDPVRSGKGIRRPPGSRILIDAEADALLRTSSAILMGWAARVRNVPGLQLSPNRHLPDKPEGVRDNCGVLARHVTQLLALPPGPVIRTWTWLPGRAATRPPAVPCRRCGLPVSPSPSGKYWWPAVCAHPSAVAAAYEEDGDGTMIPAAWACAACSARLPRGWSASPHCDHAAAADPGGWRTGAVSADVEDEIGDLEIVHAGEGWATCVTELSGIDAGLDVLDLAARFRKHLQESPARPEPLEGVPCRSCEKTALVEADPPHDPQAEKDKSRCTACGDRMTPDEYASWTARYKSYVEGSGSITCRLCELGDCRDCRFAACACDRPGHRAA